MSANRKLQSEISQVLKKVEEGVLLFDDIWEKVYAAGQQSLKEKYEGDLKKEIKKLQRLRDQVKNWLGSGEVKDKAQLTEARKIIESKMEQFKICEKDTKTKAYSKEGLAREARTDPKEIDREEKRCWLNDCLERLGDLVDSIDGEVEKMTSVKGGKTKMKDQLEKLENRLQKNRWHMARLEQILKLLDNEDMDPSELERIRDDVDYYIESAADDEGAVGVDEEFDIYEDLHLDAILVATVGEDGTVTPIEAAGGVAISGSPLDGTVRPPDATIESDQAGSSTAIKKPVVVAPVTLPIVGKQTPSYLPAALKPTPAGAASPSKVLSPTSALTPGVPKVIPLSPGKAADSSLLSAVAGMGIAPKLLAPPNTNTNPKGSDSVSESSSSVTQETNGAAVVAPQSSWAAHAASAAAPVKPVVAGQPATRPLDAATPSVTDLAAQPAVQSLSSISASSSGVTTSPGIFSQQSSMLPTLEPSQSSLTQQQQQQQQQQQLAMQLSANSLVQASALHRTSAGQPQQPTNPTHLSSATGGSAHPLHLQQPAASSLQPQNFQQQQLQQQQQQQQQQISNYPNSQGPARGGLPINSDVQFTISMLKQSALNSTEVLESDRLTGYAPRNQYNTHPSFPSQPPPVIESGVLFERLPADSLFFAFYHQQGSYQQFLAAKQLKKQSWRFHKKYMTWFQRHEEPKVTSDDYEEGTYVYFDYESGWCQRIKSEFKFEYNYLEDEIAQPTQN